MILTAHQPAFLPWLGYFAKLAQADQFVIFDDVQFERHGYSNRVKIKTQDGPQWLTVPVEHGQPKLCEAKIAKTNWQRKHLKTIQLAYGKAPFFDQYYHPLEAILSEEWRYLAGLDRALLDWLLSELGISVPIVCASEQGFRGTKSDLVLDMCRKMGAASYIFGAKGVDYADVHAFQDAGIQVQFQDYRHPVYPQLHGEFVPGLSIIDLLFNAGPDAMNWVTQRVSRETEAA